MKRANVMRSLGGGQDLVAEPLDEARLGRAHRGRRVGAAGGHRSRVATARWLSSGAPCGPSRRGSVGGQVGEARAGCRHPPASPAARTSRRRPGSVTTVSPPLREQSVPPTGSASTVIVLPGGKRPSRSARASGFSMSRWIARFSGRAPYCGSLPSRPIERPRRRRQLEHQVVLGQPRREVGHEQVDDASERRVVERVEDDDLVDRG